MSATANPYQTPTAEVDPALGDLGIAGNAVAMRSEYLRHEGAVQSIGVLHFLSAGVFALVAGAGLLTLVEKPEAGLGMVAIGAGFGALSVWMGIGMRKLNPRVRLAVGITSGIGLLNLPTGTLINGYILYLVFGAKGKVVFSEEYASVRQQTPHMKYQTPRYVKICVVVLLLLVAAGILAVVLAP